MNSLTIFILVLSFAVLVVVLAPTLDIDAFTRSAQKWYVLFVFNEILFEVTSYFPNALKYSNFNTLFVFLTSFKVLHFGRMSFRMTMCRMGL